MTRRWLRFAAAVSLCLVTSRAVAEAPAAAPDGNKQLAIEWANRAKERFDAGNYQGAIDAIREAETHARPPTFTLLSARAHEGLAKLLIAQRLYQSIVELQLAADAPAAWVSAQQEARTRLAALTPRIPKLQLEVTGAGAASLTVTLDGALFAGAQLARPSPQDPGTHDLIVEAAGREKVVRKVTLSEGATTRVAVQLKPIGGGTSVPIEPPPAASGAPATKIAGYVSLGLGGAGLLAGAITGGIVLGEMGKINDNACRLDLGKCSDGIQKGVEGVGTLADVATAGLAIGGAFAVAGTLLLLLPRKKPAQLGIALSPGLITVRGAF